MPPRILLVEDESFIRSMMVEFLSEAGFEVDDAGNTDDALELLKKDGYALLVTDVNMPGAVDGVELAERFRQHKPGGTILIVTARPDLMRRLQRDGIDASLLPKPFDPEHLVEVVRELAKAS